MVNKITRFIEEYGRREGPTVEQLYEKYGFYDDIIYSSVKVNQGMNVILRIENEWRHTMIVEKEQNNTKWLKEDSLKIRVKKEGEKSTVAVILDGYNICFKLIMFEFIDYTKEELSLDVSVTRHWNNQRVFIIDSKDSLTLASYISQFIKEWDIKVSENTVSDADIISDELWYGQT